MANQNINDQEQHYKSLIELFKYCVTFAGILFTVVALVVSYLTYKDGQEMRADRKDARQEIQNNLKEMKDEIRVERTRMDQKSSQAREELAQREKELSKKEEELENSVVNLIRSTNQEINSTKNNALRQIAGVKNEATIVARSAAKDRINEVFKEKNLEPFIESVAKDKLEPKIQQLVNNQFKKSTDLLESKIDETQLLTEVGVSFFDYGSSKSVLILDSLSRYSRSPNVRLKAKNLIKSVYVDYHTSDTEKLAEYDVLSRLPGENLSSFFLQKEFPNYKNGAILPDQPTLINMIYNTAKSKEKHGNDVGLAFFVFNKLTGGKIEFFDFSALEQAYTDYQKRRFPLKMYEKQ